MPASLLDSQLRALQPPDPDERAIELDIETLPQALVEQAMALLEPSA